MDNLNKAIVLLEREVDTLLDTAPDATTVDWWTLRGKSTGLTLLRSMRAEGLTEPSEAEAFRRSLRKEISVPINGSRRRDIV